MLKEFTEAQKTPKETPSYDTYGAPNLVGVEAGELKTGYIKQTMADDADQEGNTRDGNPYERAGFLSPVLANTR